jgi:hypothetical protein
MPGSIARNGDRQPTKSPGSPGLFGFGPIEVQLKDLDGFTDSVGRPPPLNPGCPWAGPLGAGCDQWTGNGEQELRVHAVKFSGGKAQKRTQHAYCAARAFG